jgi:hypothetical protein
MDVNNKFNTGLKCLKWLILGYLVQTGMTFLEKCSHGDAAEGNVVRYEWLVLEPTLGGATAMTFHLDGVLMCYTICDMVKRI